jgi:hypothetical protein
MKRRLSFLAAALAATATAPAFAQADPGKMFLINAVTPGVVSFSGEGTAQFNNSSSTSNAFSVGSSTNFGVNASASSTNDYMVDSNALLQLAGTSQLQQTIGTSSSAANTMAAAEAASKAADSIANRTTTSEFGQNWADYKAQNGIASDTAAASLPSTSDLYKSEASYNAARKDFFNEQMTEAFSNVTTASTTSSSQGASGQGIIRGEFITTNSNSTSIGASASSAAGNTATATESVESTMGKNHTEYLNTVASYAGSDGKINTSGEIAAAKAAGIVWQETGNNVGSGLDTTAYEATKKQKIDEQFSQLQLASASSGSVDTDSQATVTVTGVGSIATLNASDQSAFNVDVATRLRSSIPDTNGTANGAAGGNLATSSFANQSNSLAASAFIQAFGADTVKLNADSATGKLNSATINGRFDVTIDANELLSKTGTATTALEAPVISVPE